jgi:hypothetical protein
MLFACFVLVLVERHFVYRKRVFRLLAVIGWVYVMINFAAGERENAAGVRGCFGLSDGGLSTPMNNTWEFFHKYGYEAYAKNNKPMFNNKPTLSKEPYSICTQRLFDRTPFKARIGGGPSEGSFKGLSIIDLNVFAELGYMPPAKYCDFTPTDPTAHIGGCVNLTEAFPQPDGESEWVRTKRRSDDKSKDLVTWQEFYQNSTRTSIIAIRGTFSAWSALQDVNLYTAACLYQLMLAAVPFSTGFYNDDFIAVATKKAQLFRDKGKRNVEKFGNIAEYMCAIRKQGLSAKEIQGCYNDKTNNNKALDENPPVIENLIVVGHSLGGALAKIMASRNAVLLKCGEDTTKCRTGTDTMSAAQKKLHIHAVSFSGPGTVFSSLFYGFSPSDLTETVTNIVPEHDIIPQVSMISSHRCSAIEST